MKKKLIQLKEKEILVGAGLAFLIKIVGAICVLFLNVLVTRSLGAEHAGYFFLAQAFLFFFSVFVRQGLDNAIVRYVAGYQVEGARTSISGIYYLSLLKVIPLSLCVTIILWFGSTWLAEFVFSKPLLEWPLKWCSLAIMPMALSQLHSFFFQGNKRMVPAILFQSVGLSIVAIVLIWVMEPKDAVALSQNYVVSAVLVCSCAFLYWNKGRVRKLAQLPNEERCKISRSANSLFAIIMLAQTTQWLGQFLLGAWNNAEDVALFSTAQRTAMLTSFVLLAVNAIAAPKFAEANKRNDLNQLRQVAKTSGRLMTLFALPIVVFMFVFAPWLMGLFGNEFIQGENILRILALGQFVNVATGSVGYLLQMTGYEKTLRNSVFVSSVIIIVGSVIFIPLYGVLGAAAVTAFAISIQNLLCVYQVKKKLGFNTLNIFSR